MNVSRMMSAPFRLAGRRCDVRSSSHFGECHDHLNDWQKDILFENKSTSRDRRTRLPLPQDLAQKEGWDGAMQMSAIPAHVPDRNQFRRQPPILVIFASLPLKSLISQSHAQTHLGRVSPSLGGSPQRRSNLKFVTDACAIAPSDHVKIDIHGREAEVLRRKWRIAIRQIIDHPEHFKAFGRP